MRPGTQRSMARIARQFDELRALTDLAPLRVERISGWSVGQHIDHLLQADRAVLEQLDRPADETLPGVTLAGRLVLRTGWIPRGKGRAPQRALPTHRPGEELAIEINAVRSRLAAAAVERSDALTDPRPVARHHVFGGLSMAQWLRFISVHHHHHTKIIHDVLRAQPRP